MITKVTKKSAKYKDELQKAFEFFCNELDINYAMITVELSAKGFTRKTINGICQKYSDSIYSIKLRPLSFNQMLVYLAHELVHVEQYFTGKMYNELAACEENYNNEDHYMEYFNHPAEIDARKRGRELVQKYLTT